MLDLKGLKVKDLATAGSKCVLRHPGTDEPITDNGKALYLLLAGRDSTQYRTAVRKRNARIVADSQTRRRKGLSEFEAEVMAERSEEEDLTVLVACTLGWGWGEAPGTVLMEGEELACTPENARRFYSELPWAVEQAEKHIADRANFLPASKTN